MCGRAILPLAALIAAGLSEPELNEWADMGRNVLSAIGADDDEIEEAITDTIAAAEAYIIEGLPADEALDRATRETSARFREMYGTLTPEQTLALLFGESESGDDDDAGDFDFIDDFAEYPDREYDEFPTR